jgi:hypothetical protein
MGIVNFVQSISDADEDRLSKVQACINLNKAMFYHDYEYQDKVMEFVDTTLTEKNDIIADMAKRAILNCFTKISMTQTAKVNKINKKINIQQNKINKTKLVRIKKKIRKYQLLRFRY